MPVTSTDNRTIQYELLQPQKGVTAFSTLRHGGVSKGAYASLNCGLFTNDVPEDIAANLQAAFQSAGIQPREVFLPHQVHGDGILIIEKEHLALDRQQKAALLEGWDALVTYEEDILIGVSTADCIPLILYDPVRRVTAAVHAGWKGTLKDITGKAVRLMKDAFGCQSGDILAVIGPGISLEAFEVGEEVFRAFHESGYDMDGVSRLNPVSGKHHIDLPQINFLQLRREGIPSGHIQKSGLCTHTFHEDFFSARRLGTDSGRMLTAVMMNQRSI